MNSAIPILYSFRRCPYAIRARMAILSANIKVELREVDLKYKPDDMLRVSPKGTVPVLVNNNSVFEESFDIMLWALRNNDPENYLGKDEINLLQAREWTHLIDGDFKYWLDFYKYHDRFPDKTQKVYRANAAVILEKMEQVLTNSTYLLGSSLSIADIVVFPFVRQFAFVDRQWFDHCPYTALNAWFNKIVQNSLFIGVMEKIPPWKKGDPILYFPDNFN